LSVPSFFNQSKQNQSERWRGPFMQFSEKQLGDLFVKNYNVGDFVPFKNIHKYNVRQELEKPTLDDTRSDYVVSIKNRMLWVVEFKIVAEPSSIKQAYGYYDCFLSECMDPTIHGIGKISIAAQFFKDDTIFFAQKLGVELIQISPINYGSALINIVTRHYKPWIDSKKCKRKGFRESYTVAYGK